MNLFQTIKMQGEYWGVFIINPADDKDRYLLTNPLDKKSDAANFAREFNRIALVFEQRIRDHENRPCIGGSY